MVLMRLLYLDLGLGRILGDIDPLKKIPCPRLPRVFPSSRAFGVEGPGLGVSTQ